MLLVIPRQTRAADPETTKEAPRRIGLSLSIAQDLGLHEGSDVCSRESQLGRDYACFRASGTQYYGTPLATRGGTVRLVPAPATTRLLLGFDRLFFDHVTVGLRVGWVLLGGGPRPSGSEAPEFLPFHGEARLGYTFGESSALQGTVYGSVGVAQFDTEYRVVVEEDTSKLPPATQLDNPASQALSAYRKSGTGFVGVGIAAMYAVSPSFGVSLGLKLTKTFPSTGTLLSPEISGVYRF